LKPPAGVTPIENVAVCPAVVVADPGDADRAKSPVPPDEPEPERVADCGLPEALSVTFKVPVRVPDAVGVKVTLIVQLALGASELPHVLVSAKSPLAEMPLMVNDALPVLVRVTD